MSSPQTRQVLQAPGKPVVINSSTSTGPLPQNVANAAQPMHHPAEAEQLEGHGEDLGRETMNIPRTEELAWVQPSLITNTLYSSRIGRRATPKMAGFPPPDLNGISIPFLVPVLLDVRAPGQFGPTALRALTWRGGGQIPGLGARVPSGALILLKL